MNCKEDDWYYCVIVKLAPPRNEDNVLSAASKLTIISSQREKQLRLNSILKRRDHPRRPPIQSHCV